MARRFQLAWALGSLWLTTGCGVLGGNSDKKDEAKFCDNDLAYFEANVWKPTLAITCVGCHNSSGVAARTRMVLSNDAGAMEANFKAFQAVAQPQVDGVPLVLLKPTGKHPDGHGGGVILKADSPAFTSIERLSKRLQGAAGSCDLDDSAGSCDPATAQGRRLVRLLTRREFANSVSDVFGISSTAVADFTPERTVHGFDNNASAIISDLLLAQINGAGDQLGAKVVEDLARIFPCDTATTGEEECGKQFVRSFGLRLFRRPLQAEELTRYDGLFQQVHAVEGYKPALATVVSALLQSPFFLYRSELGVLQSDGTYALTGYEIATELSYLLWGSTPDAALLAAAGAGDLNSPEGIAREAKRLLDSTRSRYFFERFTQLWLQTQGLPELFKDETINPGLTPEVRLSMLAETTTFFESTLREGGSFQTLLSSDQLYASDTTAEIYGVTPPKSIDPQAVAAPTERRGILSHPSFLASHAHDNGLSIIPRGKTVRERLLCQELSPPPAALNVMPPEQRAGATSRERLAEHTNNPTCNACHRLIDPIGWGFEKFGPDGRIRPLDQGKPVDVSGEILSTRASDGAFQGLSELSERLGASEDAQKCFATQMFRYGYGLSESTELSCVERALFDKFAAAGFRLDALVFALTEVPHFTRRNADTGFGAAEASLCKGPPATDVAPSPGTTPAPGTPSPVTPMPPITDVPPPPANDLSVDYRIDRPGSPEYCVNIKITNTSDRALTWKFSRTIEGKFQPQGGGVNVWNATVSANSGTVEFSGKGYNDVLQPRASTDLGFCAVPL